MSWFILKFRTLSVFCVRSCMAHFFSFVFPFSCALELLRDSTMAWLAQIVWITKGYCLWVCHNAFGLFFFFFFPFSFFFYFFFFFFSSCEVSTLALSQQPTVVAELPSFPTALGQPLIQQCVPHHWSRLPVTALRPAFPFSLFVCHPFGFLCSGSWDEKSTVLNVSKINPI